MNSLQDLKLGVQPQGPSLLTADWVLGHGPGGHRLLRKGEVVIDGNHIVFVGHSFEGNVARRIEFGRALISPGLIDLDALSDLDTTTLAIDHHPAWAKGRIWPRSYVERGPYEMYTPEELAFQKRFAFAQLLLNGITTAAPIASLFYREWGETPEEFIAAADAAGEMGLRVYLSPAFRSGGMVVEAPNRIEPVFDEARGMKGLADASNFIAEQDGRFDGLVSGMLMPDRVETCTEMLLRETDAAARDLGCKFRLHMAQSQMERDVMHRLHGSTAPAWLERLGLLSDRLIAPHATYATEDDLKLYANNDVNIVHCPLVYARGSGSVLRSFGAVKAMGINIAMGTDTAPPDMLLNLLTGLIAARIAEANPNTVSAADMWDAATLGGAQALGRDDLGRLAAGAQADIAVFGLNDTIMTPAIDPITTLVAGGSGKVTGATFVGGRLSMRAGEVAGIDLDIAQAQAQLQFDGLIAKYPDRSWDHPPVPDLFPSSYPLQEAGTT